MIKTKRIYTEDIDNKGYRILVDRIWPRGISKEKANLDEWLKELAPSTALRKWFGHDPEKFDDFSSKYKDELKAHTTEIERIRKLAHQQVVILLYGAKDEKHNQAIVLKEVIEKNKQYFDFPL